MIERREYKDAVWVDLYNPSQEEAESIAREFDLDPFLIRELTYPNAKPKVELHSNAILLILHVPTFKYTNYQETAVQEIDFLVGDTFVVTTRYEHIPALEHFAHVLEVNTTLNKSHVDNAATFIFFQLIKEIYESLTNELESIDSVIEEISRDMFKGQEKQMLFSISHVTRTLLEFKKTILSHKEMLRLLEYAGERRFGSLFAYYVGAIRAEYSKIETSLSISEEVIANLRETNTSLVNTEQNDIMLTLTAVAFLVFPLSLIVNLFFLDTISNILPAPPYDLWVLLALLVGVASFLTSIFKYKGWL